MKLRIPLSVVTKNQQDNNISMTAHAAWMVGKDCFRLLLGQGLHLAMSWPGPFNGPSRAMTVLVVGLIAVKQYGHDG